MPPCAATVCERVGNTLVMHAVVRPVAARPKVARRPAPPAPTTTMSYLCSLDLVAFHAISSASCSAMRRTASTLAAAPRKHRNLMRDLQRELDALRVHVVLDHDLQAELRVPEQPRPRTRSSAPRSTAWRSARAPRRSRMCSSQHDPDEPERRAHQRDGGHALDHEVVHADCAEPRPRRDLQRRAELLRSCAHLRASARRPRPARSARSCRSSRASRRARTARSA